VHASRANVTAAALDLHANICSCEPSALQPTRRARRGAPARRSPPRDPAGRRSLRRQWPSARARHRAALPSACRAAAATAVRRVGASLARALDRGDSGRDDRASGGGRVRAGRFLQPADGVGIGAGTNPAYAPCPHAARQSYVGSRNHVAARRRERQALARDHHRRAQQRGGSEAAHCAAARPSQAWTSCVSARTGGRGRGRKGPFEVQIRRPNS
jgi:hypothetical protein